MLLNLAIGLMASAIPLSHAGLILARDSDITTPLADAAMLGFNLAPAGVAHILSSDNLVRCNKRVSIVNEVEGLVFGVQSAIASKNSLSHMLQRMGGSSNNATITAGYDFSQECRGAGASLGNYGKPKLDHDVDITAVDLALWIVIEHCVRANNMTGYIEASNGLRVDITEWPNEERCGARYSLRGEAERVKRRALHAAFVVGFLGLLTHF